MLKVSCMMAVDGVGGHTFAESGRSERSPHQVLPGRGEGAGLADTGWDNQTCLVKPNPREISISCSSDHK